MRMDGYFGTKKILNSIEAEQGAERFLSRLKEGKLQMDILPNTYERFSGGLEERDYVSYCDFLSSFNGKKVLSMLEEEDAR